jgi:predicted PurR-regulated permease PerM
VVMLFVIHMIEWYFLNPRLVGKSLNIPAPVIFIILFISEHFMGISGFFLGVPLYLLLIEFVDALARKIIPEREHQ